MSEAVRYEVEDAAAWVTIDRPEARNALNRAVREGLAEAFERAEHDDDALVVVLTGSGDKAFCAGGDLKEMVEERLTVPPPTTSRSPAGRCGSRSRWWPLYNGLALAGGFLLTQCADLVVAADHARFGISEAKVGRGAPWAAPLPWLVPPRIALQLLLTGEPLTAQRAYDVGLVNDVVPAAELVARTRELAATIAANTPLSVRAGKEMVYAVAEHGRSEAYDVAERIRAPVYASEDAQEGPRAFAKAPTGLAGPMSGCVVPGLVADLAAEAADLAALLDGLPERCWSVETPAPGWAVRDQVAHLAHFDYVTRLAVAEPDALVALRESLATRPGGLQAYVDSIGPAHASRSGRDVLGWWPSRATCSGRRCWRLRRTCGCRGSARR